MIDAMINEALNPIVADINAITIDINTINGEIVTINNDIAGILPGLVLPASISFSNTELKAGTDKIIVAAPGANKLIVPLQVITRLNYGGTNAFTAGSIFYTWDNNVVLGQNLNLDINNTTTDICTSTVFLATQQQQSSLIVNKAFYMTVNSLFTGNLANDNTIDIWLYYTVLNV